MSSLEAEDRDLAASPGRRRREIAAFAILAILIWPFVAVAVVGGYGFLVWMYQIVFGPPGPPGTFH
jgi:nitrate reductase NapE